MYKSLQSTTHASSAPLPNGQTESAKVSISQVSVNRTQLTKGGYTTLTTMQEHLVMQGSTLLILSNKRKYIEIVQYDGGHFDV